MIPPPDRVAAALPLLLIGGWGAARKDKDRVKEGDAISERTHYDSPAAALEAPQPWASGPAR